MVTYLVYREGARPRMAMHFSEAVAAPWDEIWRADPCGVGPALETLRCVASRAVIRSDDSALDRMVRHVLDIVTGQALWVES